MTVFAYFVQSLGSLCSPKTYCCSKKSGGIPSNVYSRKTGVVTIDWMDKQAENKLTVLMKPQRKLSRQFLWAPDQRLMYSLINSPHSIYLIASAAPNISSARKLASIPNPLRHFIWLTFSTLNIPLPAYFLPVAEKPFPPIPTNCSTRTIRKKIDIRSKIYCRHSNY